MSRTRRRILGSAAALFMLVLFLIGFATESPAEPTAIVYAIPVVLIAIALGPAAGALSGAAGGILFLIAARSQAGGIDSLEILYRLVLLAIIGTIAGVVAKRLEASERSERASRELAEQVAERLEEAQQTAHLGSWEWDVRADAITWSNELFRIFGVTPERFDTTFNSYLGLIHPDDRELVEGAVRRAFETQDPFAFSHRLVRPDGTIRVVESAGRAFTEKGQVVRMAGTALDVTERTVLEDEARAAREKLLLREERSDRAVELNDEVVQGLALAHYLLSAGDTAAATAAVRSTLDRAKRLVGDLIDADELEPGGLRRENPAAVE